MGPTHIVVILSTWKIFQISWIAESVRPLNHILNPFHHLLVDNSKRVRILQLVFRNTTYLSGYKLKTTNRILKTALTLRIKMKKLAGQMRD